MSQQPLYQEITEAIRRDIVSGNLQPGDELPPIREMAAHWHCAPGTIQRVYRQLARSGLISSRPGQGTIVLPASQTSQDNLLRRATLVNEADSFLLRMMSAGYSIHEVEQAVQLAMDRWREISAAPDKSAAHTLRFTGSHDPAVILLALHFDEIMPGYQFDTTFRGSLGGLMALAQHQADIAGSHLWDVDTQTYNQAFVRRLMPNRKIALLTLAHRQLGLIVAPGNPLAITNLVDLARSGIRFINRQAGAGTRVWLDTQLRQLNMDPATIDGYEDATSTHSAVARAVLEGSADVGLGIEAAARACGLEFHQLTTERYDLVIPEAIFNTAPIQRLGEWLTTTEAKQAIDTLGGYVTQDTGCVDWVV